MRLEIWDSSAAPALQNWSTNNACTAQPSPDSVRDILKITVAGNVKCFEYSTVAGGSADRSFKQMFNCDANVYSTVDCDDVSCQTCSATARTSKCASNLPGSPASALEGYATALSVRKNPAYSDDDPGAAPRFLPPHGYAAPTLPCHAHCYETIVPDGQAGDQAKLFRSYKDTLISGDATAWYVAALSDCPAAIQQLGGYSPSAATRAGGAPRLGWALAVAAAAAAALPAP
jgi:hypothetical protein